MSTSTEDVAIDLGFVAQAVERGRRAEKTLAVLRQQFPAPWQAFAVLLLALGDVPRLAALAERGVLDRTLIQQHAGQQERAQAVRDLHAPVKVAGVVVCVHCTTEFRLVLHRCPTLVALDG